MAVAVHGLEALEGDTAFAFVVLRLRTVVDRTGLVEVLRFIAPMVPDADQFIDELADQLDGELQMIAVPWAPPEAGHGVTAQKRLIEGAGAVGVEAAWFFQTGTSLPPAANDDDDDDEDDDGDDDGDDTSAGRRAATATGETRASGRPPTEEIWGNDSWAPSDPSADLPTDPHTVPVELVDITVDEDTDHGIQAVDAADDDEDDEVAEWSNGPPPQVTSVRFPVDNYPAIVDELDWEDFGIAFKLVGTPLLGENTLLLAFHTLWLAPYGDRYRNTAVTIDTAHHSAHLWVDRFAVPCSAAELVHHLLWVVAMIDKVVPVLHARFAEATMAQKYGGLLGDTSEPFVLGGNPLLSIHADGGETAVDAWLANQIGWSPEECAQMLRELAVEIVTAERGDGDPADVDDVDDDDDDDDVDEEEDHDSAADRMDADRSDESDAEADDEDDVVDADDGDDDDLSSPERRDRGVTTWAADVLRSRAIAGTLDPRAVTALTPVLEQPAHYDQRRRVVEIVGALRHRPAVSMLVEILGEPTRRDDETPLHRLVAATASALGAIGDPAAVPALVALATAAATPTASRTVAASAIASCIAAAPRAVDDAGLGGVLAALASHDPGAGTYVAYGRLARQLPPHHRVEAKRRIAEHELVDAVPVVRAARQIALLLASPAAPPPVPTPELRTTLHDALTEVDDDHDAAIVQLAVALQIAELVVEIVDPADVVWLTRFAEPELRAAAHHVLAKLGKPLPPAPTFDAAAARALDDAALVTRIGESHVVGRAALIAEAARRDLSAARRPIVDACHDVLARARPLASLLRQDARVLEVAVPALVPLDTDSVKLFDRILRHSNTHVKWALLRDPPRDPRLIGGMFHVLGEHWGWQEKAAKKWLARYKGTEAYEAERRRVPVADHGDDEGIN